jgi:hypothetical protein
VVTTTTGQKNLVVFFQYEKQSGMPDEVIADDGSTQEAVILIKLWQQNKAPLFIRGGR